MGGCYSFFSWLLWENQQVTFPASPLGDVVVWWYCSAGRTTRPPDFFGARLVSWERLAFCRSLWAGIVSLHMVYQGIYKARCSRFFSNSNFTFLAEMSLVCPLLNEWLSRLHILRISMRNTHLLKDAAKKRPVCMCRSPISTDASRPSGWVNKY